FILVYAFYPDEKSLAAKKRLGVGEEREVPNRVVILRWTRPLFAPLSSYALKKLKEEARGKLRKQLVSAGLREELTPEEFVAFQWILTGIVSFMALYLLSMMGNSVPLPLWPLVFIGAYFTAQLWLNQRIQIRRKAIIQALPYTMDLLTLSVEAGLDFMG